MCTCDGTCQCLPSSISGRPYTGSACDCSPDNNTCINPNTPGVSYLLDITNNFISCVLTRDSATAMEIAHAETVFAMKATQDNTVKYAPSLL